MSRAQATFVQAGPGRASGRREAPAFHSLERGCASLFLVSLSAASLACPKLSCCLDGLLRPTASTRPSLFLPSLCVGTSGLAATMARGTSRKQAGLVERGPPFLSRVTTKAQWADAAASATPGPLAARRECVLLAAAPGLEVLVTDCLPVCYSPSPSPGPFSFPPFSKPPKLQKILFYCVSVLLAMVRTKSPWQTRESKKATARTTLAPRAGHSPFPAPPCAVGASCTRTPHRRVGAGVDQVQRVALGLLRWASPRQGHFGVVGVGDGLRAGVTAACPKRTSHTFMVL